MVSAAGSSTSGAGNGGGVGGAQGAGNGAQGAGSGAQGAGSTRSADSGKTAEASANGKTTEASKTTDPKEAKAAAQREATATKVAGKIESAYWSGTQKSWNNALGSFRDAVNKEKTPADREKMVGAVLDHIPADHRQDVTTAIKTALERPDSPRNGPLDRAPGGMRSKTANSPEAAGIVSGDSLAHKLEARNKVQAAESEEALSEAQKKDKEDFKANYQANQARYEAVAAKTGIPAEAVAAIHWRESRADFGTYLHQGDPLGKPAVHVPNNIPTFHDWESAAVHALGLKDSLRKSLGIDATTTDQAKLNAFAEAYNGLGYAKHNVPSAYVYSGTTTYEGGKYTSDGNWDPNYRDQQLGFDAMVAALRS